MPSVDAAGTHTIVARAHQHRPCGLRDEMLGPASVAMEALQKLPTKGTRLATQAWSSGRGAQAAT